MQFVSSQQVQDVIATIRIAFTAREALKIVRKQYPTVNLRAVEIYISYMVDIGLVEHAGNGCYRVIAYIPEAR